MRCLPFAAVMFAYILDLRVAVMAWSDDYIRTCGIQLLELGPATGPSILHKTGLQGAASAAAAIVIGLVRPYIYEILCADHLPYDKAQVIGHFITYALPDQFAWILYSEFEPFRIPRRTHFQFTLANPTGIKGYDAYKFKGMRNLKTAQSFQDRIEHVASLGVYIISAPQRLYDLHLFSQSLLPILWIPGEKAIIGTIPPF